MIELPCWLTTGLYLIEGAGNVLDDARSAVRRLACAVVGHTDKGFCWRCRREL